MLQIYYDVCRPNTSEKVPALLALSPYGKGGHGFRNYDLMPYRVGVKEEMLSGLEKFESYVKLKSFSYSDDCLRSSQG